jgi:hypothetical protein
MPYGSVAASEEVEVYASWALILVRMTYGSVGAAPWTTVQEKLHPAVAEPEFTSLNLSHIPVPHQGHIASQDDGKPPAQVGRSSSS